MVRKNRLMATISIALFLLILMMTTVISAAPDSGRAVSLEISKIAPAVALPGAHITYTISLTNVGDVVAKDIIITDVVPINATYISGGDYDPDENGVGWIVFSLNPGEIVHKQFVVTAMETITNEIYGARSEDGFITAAGPPVVTLVGPPEFDLTLIAPDVAYNNIPFEYAVRVENSGIYTATNLLITNTLPMGAIHVSGGALVDGVVNWTFPQLAPGEVVTVTYMARAEDTTLSGADYGVLADGGYGGSGSVAAVTLVGEPFLEISLLASQKVFASHPIRYSITVTNTGSVTATDVIISNTIPTGSVYHDGGTLQDNAVFWTIPKLGIGASDVVRFSVMATGSEAVVNDTFGASAEGGFYVVGSGSTSTAIDASLGPWLLPIVRGDDSVSEEPNNDCGQAFGLVLDTPYEFMANDAQDWYTFDLDSAEAVTLHVDLTNFVPEEGQIALYSGASCGEATFQVNDGAAGTSKSLTLADQTTGHYYLLVVNDGVFDEQNPYSLEIHTTP